MIQDTINSMRVTLSERIGNPFISSVIISLILVNWKLSFLIFSDIQYDEKVLKIVALFPDFDSAIFNLFLVPVVIGVFWTFLWPLVNWGINAYWYFLKSCMSNTKLKMEKRKVLSEKQAAELYIKIDSQESKYLEFLAERQSRIDALSDQMSGLALDGEKMRGEISSKSSAISDLQSKISDLSKELAIEKDRCKQIETDRDIKKDSLARVTSAALRAAELLPGLKAFSNAINDTANYHADEVWLKRAFRKQEPSFSDDEMGVMLELFLAIGLLRREQGDHIAFGGSFKYGVEKLLGEYNNSPGYSKPS